MENFKRTLDKKAEQALGKIVRKALEAAVKGETYLPTSPGLPALEEKCGCFVSLKTNGRLRGCLGCFTSEQPLWMTAPEYTANSALRDARFSYFRLTPDELGEVDVSISVLSPLKPCSDPDGIILGVDGIYVRNDGQSGCFLPSVARDTKWSVDEFWGHCCQDKAGLLWDAWKIPGTELFTFRTMEVHV